MNIKFFVRAGKYALFLCVSTLVLLLIAEGVLRLCFGRPKGLFHYRPANYDTLYTPDAELHLVWTPIPYTVKTNSLGFRGPEITQKKPEGVFRIIALGDSITDGFYVENENTYPWQLEQLLKDAGHSIEVVNVARGYSGIDREFEMFKRYGEPLNPDMVVLTFVCNDIEEIRGKSREQLLNCPDFSPAVQERSEWLLFGRTAIGELILDMSLTLFDKRYNHHMAALKTNDSNRYIIEGGDQFLENSHIFLNKHVTAADGISLYEEYNEKQWELINNHIFGLVALNKYCKKRNIRLVCNYFPDYSEIYMSTRKFPLSALLQEACEKNNIPFLNLCDIFKAHSTEVLHFAPLDYHPNPRGNKLIAEAVAKFLQKENLLPPSN